MIFFSSSSSSHHLARWTHAYLMQLSDYLNKLYHYHVKRKRQTNHSAQLCDKKGKKLNKRKRKWNKARNFFLSSFFSIKNIHTLQSIIFLFTTCQVNIFLLHLHHFSSCRKVNWIANLWFNSVNNHFCIQLFPSSQQVSHLFWGENKSTTNIFTLFSMR